MTCIVAKTDKTGNIWMGGDSVGSSGTQMSIRKHSKVFIVADKFIIGYTSSFRMGQLLQFKFKPPVQKKTQSDFEYMCTTFIDVLRKCLFDGGYAQKDKEKESGGTFLVGYKKNIYEVQSDFQVGQRIQNYSAVGCGEPFALGAFAGMHPDQNPKLSIERALTIASMFSPQVQAPFHIIELKKPSGAK